MTRFSRTVAFVFFLSLPTAALAQDDDGFTWENSTELSYAATSGNSSTDAFALNGELIGSGGPNRFSLEVGGIRASTDVTTRAATGTENDYQISTTTSSELTAASYRIRGRYERSFGRTYPFAAAGWERNTFAGFNHRYIGAAGIGRTWAEGESGHFKTDLGATYTVQKDIKPKPDVGEGFAGARFAYDAALQVTATTEFTSKLIADLNAERSDDYRADWINAIAVSINDTLALKTSLQVLYDRQPALVEVPLLDGSGSETGTLVTTPGEKVDTVLTLALVISL